MAWIESHETLKDHPKLYRLMSQLKISKVAAVGHLHLLWWWCLKYASEGRLDRFTPEQIAKAAEWDGNAGEFLQVLADSGFIERDPLRIHDWEEFTLHYKMSQERKERKRLQVRERIKRFRNAPVTQLKRISNAPDTQCNAANLTKPNLTKPNQTTNTPIAEPKVRELVAKYLQGLTAKLGERPVNFSFGAAGKIFKSALRDHSAEEIEKRLTDWFQSTDPFVTQNGYSLTLFASRFNLLKGGPIHAAKNFSKGRDFSVAPIAGKYANIDE